MEIWQKWNVLLNLQIIKKYREFQKIVGNLKKSRKSQKNSWKSQKHRKSQKIFGHLKKYRKSQKISKISTNFANLKNIVILKTYRKSQKNIRNLKKYLKIIFFKKLFFRNFCCVLIFGKFIFKDIVIVAAVLIVRSIWHVRHQIGIDLIVNAALPSKFHYLATLHTTPTYNK